VTRPLPRQRARVIAFYLPQYHPIPENDSWWGKGFTEWVNVARARPLFPGHYQPRVPGDLGFYDLRLAETRVAQAEMARRYGIEGFCYWHYWFGNGKRLLDRPFREVLQSGEPDFPFCLAWANQSWTGIWHGSPGRILIKQVYPGVSDYREHFTAVQEAFADERYLRVEGKPLFVVYDPLGLPDPVEFTDCWRDCARKAGLGDFHLAGIGDASWNAQRYGFDACILDTLRLVTQAFQAREDFSNKVWRGIRHFCPLFVRRPSVYPYRQAITFMATTRCASDICYSCVLPNWDNTPRTGKQGLVLHGSTPSLFRRHVRDALQHISVYEPERRILFVKSWNEWAEGNHLEPDRRFGTGYLEALADVVRGDTEAGSRTAGEEPQRDDSLPKRTHLTSNQ